MTVATLPTEIDGDAVLNVLGLNPRDPNAQALLLVCQQYDLDPVLKHMVLIKGRPYITRDGYLHVAHASGRLDGIEIVDEGETATHWWAKVAVYRKDMGHPFIYRGRFPKDSQMAKAYGPEMAIKCAEVMALRRAFDVTGIAAADEQWDADPEEAHTTVEARVAERVALPPVVVPPDVEQLNAARAALTARFAAIADDERRKALKFQLKERFGIPPSLNLEQVAEANAWLDGELTNPEEVTAQSNGTSEGSDPAGANTSEEPTPADLPGSAASEGGEPAPGDTMTSPGQAATDPTGQNLARMLAKAGLGTSGQRHAFIAAATAGATTSTAAAANNPEITAAVRSAALDLFHGRVVLDTSGQLPKLVATDGEIPSYLDGQTAEAAEPLGAEDYWDLRLVGVRGVGQAKLLRTARDICAQKGLPAPESVAEIPDDRDVREQLLTWLANQAAAGESEAA